MRLMNIARRTRFITLSILLTASLLHAEGIAGHVASVDQKAKCLTLEWNNDTEKTVCWKDTTKFSVLETGKPAKASVVSSK